jgi:acyl carrier protein
MSKSELLRLIEDTLEVPSMSLHENQVLTDISTWDSMAAVLFMNVAQELGVTISGDQIAKSRTVGDLLFLLEDRMSARVPPRERSR